MNNGLTTFGFTCDPTELSITFIKEEPQPLEDPETDSTASESNPWPGCAEYGQLMAVFETKHQELLSLPKDNSRGTPKEKVKQFRENFIAKVQNCKHNIIPDPSEYSANFFEDEDAPELQFIIPGLLPRGVVGQVYGAGGSYKSFAILDLCLRLAVAGIFPVKWMGTFPLKEQKTAFLSLEDWQPELHRRFKKIRLQLNLEYLQLDPNGDTRKISQAVRKNFLRFTRELFYKENPERLIGTDGKPTTKFFWFKQIIEKETPDLIVIDTRSKASECEENDNNLGSVESDSWLNLVQASGGSVIIISHDSKSGRTGGTTGQNAMRGASARLDDARFGLHFKTSGKYITIDNTKNNYIPKAKSVTVQMIDGHFEKSDAKQDNITDMILNAIGKSPGQSQTTYLKEINRDKTKVNHHFKILQNDEVIIRKKTNGKYGYYLREE